MNPLIPAVWAAGAVQFIILSSNVLVPSKLSYAENLPKLSTMVRQVFVVHSLYLCLVLLAFAGACIFFAPQLVGGDPLGRSISAFLAFFWILRIGLQIFYYDSDFRRRHRVADVAYTLACCFLGCVFTAAAIGMRA